MLSPSQLFFSTNQTDFRISEYVSDISHVIRNNINLALLSLIVFSLFIVPSAYGDTAKSQQLAHQLNLLDTKDRKVELFERLDKDFRQLSNRKQAEPYLDWLRERAMEDGSTFRYATLYSYLLMRLGYRNAAEQMLLSARIQLFTDHSRCKNPKDSINKYTQWNAVMLESGILSDLKNKSKRDNKKLLKSALKLEKNHKNRKGDNWLCSSIDWARALKKMDSLKKVEVKGTGHLGKTIAVTPTKDILKPAEFIDDAEWKKVRIKRLKDFKKNFYKTY